MARGLPKSYIKRWGVSKKAWQEYRKDKRAGRWRLNKVYKGPRRSKRKGNPVAKRRRRSNPGRRKKRTFTIPLAPTIGIIGSQWHPLFGWSKWGWTGAINYAKAGDLSGAIKEFVRLNSMQLVGVDPEDQYPFGYFLGQGLLPIILGIAVHKVASMLGVNRAIARSGLPYIRI